MAELYIANAIKRSLNAAFGTNFTILEFGRRRAAEMPRAAADPREYLGEAVAGGEVARGMSSILASRAAAATTTMTRLGARTAAQRAESMDLGGFVYGLLSWVFSPITRAIPALWGLLGKLLYVVFWLATAASIVYFAAQGVAVLAVLPTVQRRIWMEDVEARFGVYELVGATSRTLVWVVVQAVLLPFRIAFGIVRVVGGSQWWRDLRGVGRRGMEAAGEGMEYVSRNLRYNALTDWIWLRYYLTTNWLSRNGLRICGALLLGWLGWQHLSGRPFVSDLRTPAPDGEGVVQFRDMREMAAYFGIPQDHFLPKREQGSNWLGGGWVGGEGLGIGVDVAEERMATGDGIPKGWEEAVGGGWGDDAAPGIVVEEAESVPPVPPVEDAGHEPAEPVERVVMGKGWVGYCRLCRQRHCCEHVDAEPAKLDLLAEF